MLLHGPIVVSVVGSTVDMRLVVIMEILMQVLRIWRMRNALVDIAGPDVLLFVMLCTLWRNAVQCAIVVVAWCCLV